MKAKKALLPIFLALSLFSSTASTVTTLASTPSNITLTLNGTQLMVEQSPQQKNGMVLVPLRSIVEALGANVLWDQKTKQITVTKDKTIVQLTIDQKTAKKNGKPISLDTPPTITGGHTLVPLRFLSEAFGAAVQWDQKTRTASIAYQAVSLPVVGSYENLQLLLQQSEEANSYGNRGVLMMKSDAATSKAPTAETSASASADYSKTNTQVQGVDEADVMKTDGSYLYQVNDQKIVIAKLYPVDQMKVVSTLTFPNPAFNPIELYVDNQHLVVIGSTYYDRPYYETQGIAKGEPHPPNIQARNTVKALVYDLKDKSNLKLIREVELEGNYVSSRKVNSSLYFITNQYINRYPIIYRNATETESSEAKIPAPMYFDSATKEKQHTIRYDQIRYFPGNVKPNYLLIAGIDLTKPNQKAEVSSYLGSGENVYATENNLYVAVTKHEYFTDTPKPQGKITAMPPRYMNLKANTTVYKFALDLGKVNYEERGTVPGSILNQFSMDEHNGYFRIATTKGEVWRQDELPSTNNLYILDKNLKVTGKIEDIAPGEKIYSARFMGDRAYMVTFKNVDPLFVIDVKNPKAPKILGALKIPGYSDYLHPYDENHMIGFGKDTIEMPIKNDQDKKIDTRAYYQGMKVALFDVTDVNHPKEKFKEIIGDRGTDSELLSNHKALLFSKEKQLLAFPVTLMEVKNKEQTSSDMPPYGEFTFQGAFVYQLDLQHGFTLRKKITHVTAEEQAKAGDGWYNSNNNVERIIYIGDTLYTLSKGMIKAHDLEQLKERNSLVIESK